MFFNKIRIHYEDGELVTIIYQENEWSKRMERESKLEVNIN